MQKLPPEQRKALASLAAKTRWAAKKAAAKGDAYAEVGMATVPAPQQPEQEPAVHKQSRTQCRQPKRAMPAPKAFGAAHSYAEKRLAKCLEERAYHANMWAARNAEIPSLVQIITALKSSQNPAGIGPSPAAYSDVAPWDANPQGVLAPTPAQQIAATRVRGGAVGIDLGDPDEDEDRFLKESGLPGGEWH